MGLPLPLVFGAALGAEEDAQFRPGEVWLDTAGRPIQAHGGGVLFHGGVYYWYGEDRTPGAQTGVSCYSSTDLLHWKPEGVVFPHDALAPGIRDASFIERPKVVFNRKTGKFVLWMHLEQRSYHFSSASVAVSDRPAGPFVFLQCLRPISSDPSLLLSPADAEKFLRDDGLNRQKELGGTFRDMNLYVDDDERAYVFYASEGNWTMYVVRLNDEYTSPQSPVVHGRTWARILAGRMREAPAPFKSNGRYYLITSGCTGWKPNAADCAVADHILGPYEPQGNPCTGPDAALTFGAQSTGVLPARNRPGGFIFMADRWSPRRLSESRYIWLPFTVKPDAPLAIDWRDAWDYSAFQGLFRALR
jgi:hypothetical protein